MVAAGIRDHLIDGLILSPLALTREPTSPAGDA